MAVRSLVVRPVVVGEVERFIAELDAHHWSGHRLSGRVLRYVATSPRVGCRPYFGDPGAWWQAVGDDAGHVVGCAGVTDQRDQFSNRRVRFGLCGQRVLDGGWG